MRLVRNLSILTTAASCLALSGSVGVIAGDTPITNTTNALAGVIAPELALQSGTLGSPSVNTDQCLLAVDQAFQDGFSKDDIPEEEGDDALDEIPTDPMGMKACGDTDMELPDLKDDGGKEQFCSETGDATAKKNYRRELRQLARDLRCKQRAHKRANDKLECLEKRLGEMANFLTSSLTPQLSKILGAAKKQISDYTAMIDERERQGKQLAKRAAELNGVLAAIQPVLSNPFIASQGDDFYRNFLKSQEQEKTRFAIDSCMKTSNVGGLKCGGSKNMTPYEFVICRAGEVATGKVKAGRLTDTQAARKKSAEEGVRKWIASVSGFEAIMSPAEAQAAAAAGKTPNIMDDVAFQRRLSTTIEFPDVPTKSGVVRANVSPQAIMNEFSSRLADCKTQTKDDPILSEKLKDIEKNSADQYMKPMTDLATAYKSVLRAATGNPAVDVNMSTCNQQDVKMRRDCVYHLASQLRSAISGDNESGIANPYGRIDARALGLRVLPNPHTAFSRPLKSELDFGGKNMSLNFSCRGIEQCIQQYKNYDEQFQQVVEQGRAKLKPGSPDMNAFSDAMQAQVGSASAQLSQISKAIGAQWAQLQNEIKGLKGDPSSLESDTGEGDPDDAVESDKTGLPSIGKLLKQAKSQGGMFKVPNKGIADAGTALTKARGDLDEKFAKVKSILNGFNSRVASCESKSKKKLEDDIVALCGNLEKDEGKGTLADFLQNTFAINAFTDLVKCETDYRGDPTKIEDCKKPILSKAEKVKKTDTDGKGVDDKKTLTRAERCDEIQTALMDKKFNKYSGNSSVTDEDVGSGEIDKK